MDSNPVPELSVNEITRSRSHIGLLRINDKNRFLSTFKHTSFTQSQLFVSRTTFKADP